MVAMTRFSKTMYRTKLFYVLLISVASCAATVQQDYVVKFNQYQKWKQSLPAKPTADFLQFIHKNDFLAQKLREQWLASLGQQKDWQLFRENYQASNRFDLQCYAAFANYSLGFKEQALNTAKNLWLSADLRPQACKPLFDILIKSSEFNDNMIDKRIMLALDKGNILLVNYLLSQYKIPKKNYLDLVAKILRNPANIAILPHTNFAGDFYVYGLKRLVDLQKKSLLLKMWQAALAAHRLTAAQEQNFIIYYASYLARQYDEKALDWFAQIKFPFPDVSILKINLQIKLALLHKDWRKITTLLNMNTKNITLNPSWQYWLARALEAQGEKEKSQKIYKDLAKNKHYYGFLANMHLTQQQQLDIAKLNTIVPKEYDSIIKNITALTQQKHENEAFALFKDFISELPKNEKIALLYWASNTLHWYDKVIALCNNDELKDQLYLRFPLAYKDTIVKFATAYNLPIEFIYAVIRQESSFKSNIFSLAGAIGIMQIMPTTASSIAKRKHIHYKNSQDLLNIKLNIQLGCTYLAILSHEYFNKNILIAAAAYNAGPKTVKHWLKTLPNDMDIWIDTLPFNETREYLKNIVVFYIIYQGIIHGHKEMPKGHESSLNPMFKPLGKAVIF